MLEQRFNYKKNKDQGLRNEILLSNHAGKSKYTPEVEIQIIMDKYLRKTGTWKTCATRDEFYTPYTATLV